MANKEKQLHSVSETLLPIVEAPLTLVQDQDENEKGFRTFKIQGYEDFMENLTYYSEQAESYQYKEEDRQDVKKLNAGLKRLIKETRADIRDQESELFTPAKEQVREIENQVMNIVSTLQKNIDAEDERDRHEKYTKLEALFNDGKRAYDTLRDTSLEFTHITEANWTNRSMSQTKITEEVHKRLRTLDALMSDDTLPEHVTIDTVVYKLQASDWDGLVANQMIKKDEQERLEQIELEEARKALAEQKRLKAEAEAEAAEELKRLKEERLAAEAANAPVPEPEPTYSTLEIDDRDRAKVEQLLTNAGIKYTFKE